MPHYHTLGQIPPKRHTQFRKPDGNLYSEQLVSTEGFSDAYSLTYHVYPPTLVRSIDEPISVKPEIMVPLIGKPEEFQYLAKIIRETADKIIAERGAKFTYQVGTMMEIPRATLVADKVSGGSDGAEFFSFGTNDLTQMTFGYSRDDIGSFLPDYLDKKVLLEDPFVSIDQDGVGSLVDLGVKKGREGRPGLKCGVCGEHGGDPESVKFFHRTGLDYVSCSPYRVPVARLAAAQAVIEEKRKAK